MNLILHLLSGDSAKADRAVLVAERDGSSIDDALIVAAALIAGCQTPYSDDIRGCTDSAR